MTTTASPDSDGPTTVEEFQTELNRLVRTADANGLDVEGGWVCNDSTDRPTWDVEIVEVESTR